ncbi:hypothetical protein DSO57_1035350 [Entomophthora muscae]|uniref:Uncharacterized protein n=1 Tax=Entomophthora muscae TaxID=34485 RepID=A0ACC2TLP4_9FUNG|nr:hypothetical protein DSO57_1035350 [Entomophthora muscae]
MSAIYCFLNFREGKRALFVECNVAVEEHLNNLFEVATKEFGGANIVINNAGITRNEDLGGSLDYIDDLVQINLVSVIKGTSLAIQHFKGQNCQEKKKDFNIINIGSILGLRPEFSAPVYSLTKTAVISFSQTLGYLADIGIRVNCIAPCFIDTNLMKDIQKSSLDVLVQSRGGYMDVSLVEKAFCHLLDNKELVGEVYEVDPAHLGLIPKAK